jgi:murein endopeptidase
LGSAFDRIRPLTAATHADGVATTLRGCLNGVAGSAWSVPVWMVGRSEQSRRRGHPGDARCFDADAGAARP